MLEPCMLVTERKGTIFSSFHFVLQVKVSVLQFFLGHIS